jgi:hypothetical protein
MGAWMGIPRQLPTAQSMLPKEQNERLGIAAIGPVAWMAGKRRLIHGRDSNEGCRVER